MKQHITKEQAREIYKRMCEYLPTIGLAPKGYYDLSEWLTIGTMIEILEESSSIFNIIRYDDCNGKQWNVRGTLFGRKHYEALRPELCDALWEAVKAIL